MGIVIVAVALVLLIWFVRSARRAPNAGGKGAPASPPLRRKESARPPRRQPSAIELAARVKSAADYVALQHRLDDVERRLAVARTESAYDSLMAHSERLERALDIAGSKTIAWQLITDDDLRVPGVLLASAYAVFPVRRCPSGTSEGDLEQFARWQELTPLDEPESAPDTLPLQREFRAIVEAPDSAMRKIKRIDALYSGRESLFAELGLWPREGYSAGQDWVAGELKAQGVPMAYELVARGVLDIAAVGDIDPASFRKMKGVGPAKLKQLQDLQARLREQKS